ncbi:hypothetical protein CHLNCDRAFT_52903 [Chlorella variabilis]|uniref:SCP domain-containing protein n=2 Tax=Chlorella variabilis TaxID=554065 RepID=E1ZHH9_CHLVA|nr:hypothetical protein CHLNCDRAFT_52903 [Chlorella variabilis]EFN54465.1 hypothetical protein CHLNCDRAFT_52903 [Chlorella variabilis]|eukprot:XP_005846567.1 hypothetical protein CHLNCDRAFT_52903 [Chlorella variabilis]
MLGCLLGVLLLAGRSAAAAGRVPSADGLQGRKLLQDPDGALSNEQCCAAIQEGRLINCICSASPGGDTGTAQTDGTTKGQGTAAANNGGSTGAGGGAEAAPIGQGVRCPDAEVVLELHNRPRLSRGAQPLQWSESLAADAAAWSAQCNRDSFGYSAGACATGMQSWLDEEALWSADNPVNMNAGHFTQVVWKATTQVQRYIEDVWGGSISAEAYTPASFLCDVPERRRRVRAASASAHAAYHSGVTVTPIKVGGVGEQRQHSDHATLLLELAAPPAVQRDSTAQKEHTSAPPQQRQFELGTAEQLAAAVALLAGTQRQLDALAAAAESAASPAALEQLAAAFAELMVETLDGAGMRQRSSNGGAQRPHSLPRSLQRQYGIRDARRAQRNAVQQAAVAQQRGIGPEQQDAALRRELDLQQPAPVDLGELGEAAQRRQLAQLQEALAKGGASRLEHYVHNVVGALNLAPAMFGQRETYLDAVRRRQDREALAQLRTGSHWGAEETGRWTRRPREQRVCPHCHDGIEDAPHMLLTCPLYAPLRLNFPDLFAEPHPPHRFLRQKPCRLAAFAAACHQRWLTATVALPAVPP